MIGNRLERYIAMTVLTNILIIAFIIMCLASLFAFIDQLGDFKNSYGAFAALKFILLTLPRRIYETLPMASLVGSLIGLGSLASRSELTVMRAAGVSTGRIVLATLRPIFIIMVFSVIMGEYVIPYAETNAQSGKELALSENGSLSIRNTATGLWLKQGNEYIQINSVQPNGLLLGVTRYFKDGQKIKYASYSQKALYRNQQWQLENTQTTFLTPERATVTQSTLENWDVTLTPELLTTINSDPENLSLSGLWQYIHYLSEQNLNNDRYWLAFWQKIFQPFETLSLAVLAISFIFGPLRSVTMGQRIFTGIVIGFVFKIGQSLLGPASLVFRFPPILAVLIPMAICLLFGLFLLKRRR